MAGICTVWLAVDEATQENGCMAVIPGSHRGGFSEYEAVADAAGQHLPDADQGRRGWTRRGPSISN